MNRLLIGALAALMIATAASAADKKKPSGPAPNSPPTAGRSGVAGSGLLDENVLFRAPSGFKLGFQDRKGDVATIELVPAGETLENWSRMVTMQTFHRVRGADPDTLPKSMSPSWKAACPGGTSEMLSHQQVNGYGSATWRFVCPMNPATRKPETMWMNLIAGADALYAVQYAFRRAPTEDMSAEALTYLKSMTVCDTRKRDHPCPKVDPVPLTVVPH